MSAHPVTWRVARSRGELSSTGTLCRPARDGGVSFLRVRVLALADEPPPADVDRLICENEPDVLVTLGDLQPQWLGPAPAAGLPRIGVHGNHDGPDALAALGIRDLHLRLVELGGWTFAGFEGSVRHGRGGAHQYSQEQATRLVERLPAADVLICHCPPRGINDEPGDRAHVGFDALRNWVERHQPLYLLHGHTTPDPRRRVGRLGRTRVVWVRGARNLVLER
jgi:hypothetical protein